MDIISRFFYQNGDDIMHFTPVALGADYLGKGLYTGSYSTVSGVARGGGGGRGGRGGWGSTPNTAGAPPHPPLGLRPKTRRCPVPDPS